MRGLATPISAIMIDPTGRAHQHHLPRFGIVEVKLPLVDTVLEDCDAVPTESGCAEFCTDVCAEAVRRGLPVIVDVDRAMSRREGLLTASTHLVFRQSRSRRRRANATRARP